MLSHLSSQETVVDTEADEAGSTTFEPADPATGNSQIAQELLSRTSPEIRAQADAILRDRYPLKRIVDDVARLGVAGEREIVAAVYLTGLSRLLPKPLAMIVQGPSSSGKSFIVQTVARLVPPEGLIRAQQISPKALFHKEPGSLVHRFVVAGERSRLKNDDAAEATRALREMLSSGSLSKLVTGREGGVLKTKPIHQPGPIAFVETTTSAAIFDEDRNRCLLLSTDETPEQTARIIRSITQRAKTCCEDDRLIETHHALQRMLAAEQASVIVPFSDKLGEQFPKHRPEARRAILQVLSMIQASALLHSYQRDRHDGAIVATAADYDIAKRLLDKPMRTLLGGGVSDGAKRLFDRLLKWANGPFTTTEVVWEEYHRVTDKTVREWLNELRGAGWLTQVKAPHGRHPAEWKITQVRAEDRHLGALPSVQSVCG